MQAVPGFAEAITIYKYYARDHLMCLFIKQVFFKQVKCFAATACSDDALK